MIHGMLMVDKPAGVTSSGILGPLRRLLRRRARVGHTGTLDPFATGVLLVLVGDATRLADLAVSLPKEYDTEVCFGRETSTLDPEGEVVRAADPGPSCPASLSRVLEGFVGEIQQTPPQYSAVKVDGQPAYRLARRGAAPPLRPRAVVVHGIRIREVRWPVVRLEIRSGPGMYVRALARDVGRAIGIPASLARLCRTAVGPFHHEEAVTFAPDAVLEPEWLASSLRSPLELAAAAGIERLHLSLAQARSVAHGNPVPSPRGGPVGGSGGLAPGRTVAVTTRDPRGEGELLLALGRVDPLGRIQPKTVLAAARARVMGAGTEP